MSQYGDLLQLPLRHAGKVRELYDVEVDGVPRILMVATDNISAYDHVLSTPIPGKGEILTALSLWWFDQLAGADGGPRVPNHLAPSHVLTLGADGEGNTADDVVLSPVLDQPEEEAAP